MIRRVTVKGIEMEVYFTHHPFRPGYREQGEPPLEPDEPEGVEIDYIRAVAGVDLQEVLITFQNEDSLLTEVTTAILGLMADEARYYM